MRAELFDDQQLLVRRALVSASGLIYWIGVLIQARRVRRHIGHSPNLKPRGSKERLLWFGWFIVIASWILQPFFLKSPSGASAGWGFDLGLWTSLLTPTTLCAGLLLVVAGYACTIWCYRAM